MKNKLSDLTNHLYAQIERLSDERLSAEEIDKECKRGEAISKLAGNVIAVANVSVNALRLVANGMVSKNDLPLMLTEGKDANT